MFPFLIKFFLNSVAVLFAMTVDNLFWINKTDISGMNLKQIISYAWNKRILAVLNMKNWRDICPAIITGFLLTAINL